VHRGACEKRGVDVEHRQVEIEGRVICQPIFVTETDRVCRPRDERERVAVADADALRGPGRAGRVEEHRRFARLRRNCVEPAVIEKAVEALAAGIVPERHHRKRQRALRSTWWIAEHQLRARVRHDRVDGLAGELEVHRDRDQAGAHDPVESGEILRAVSREDRDALAARKSGPPQTARNCVRHPVELLKADLARRPLAAEIDDRGLGEIAAAVNQVAEVCKSGHHDVDQVFVGGGAVK
jgi:hypothetical protein